MKRILPVLLLLFSLCVCGEEMKLFNFDTAESIKLWRLRGAELSMGAWPDHHPGSCARILMKKTVKDGERWPAILLDAPKLKADWSNAKELVFEVYAGQKGTLRLSLHSKSGFMQPELFLEKGRNYVRVPLPPQAVDYSGMTCFQFYMDDPVQDYVWYIGEVTLVKYDLKSKFEAADRKYRNIKTLKTKITPEIQQLRHEVDRQRQGLVQTFSSTQTDSARLSSSLDSWEESINSLEFMQQENTFAELSKGSLLALFATSQEQVHREKMVFINLPASKGKINAAANEAEALQLVLRSSKALPQVGVSLSRVPETADGSVLPLETMEITPVGYLYCEKPCYAVSRTGWWPDLLLSYVDAIDLEADKWQPFWVEAQIPAGQAPGVYKTELEVKSAGQTVAVVPLEITVHNFTLPVGTPYPNVFAVFESGKPDPRTADSPKRWRQEIWDILLKHRMNPAPLYVSSPLSVPDARKLIDSGMRNFNVRYGIGDLNQYIGSLKRIYPAYKENGLADYAYCYTFDETPPTRFKEMKEKLLEVKKQIPEVKFMTTAYDYTLGGEDSPFAGLVDIWCPMTDRYEVNTAHVQAARNRGNKVWWYVANKPLPPYASFVIENSWVGMRLLTGLKAWKFQPDGFLYYSSTLWLDPAISNLKDLPPVSGAPLANWPGRSMGSYNGDGILVYPGEKHPVLSIRAKQVRDGLEDFQYFELLKNALANSAKMSGEWQSAARKELEIEPELVTSLTVYTHDPAVLQHKRDRIAELLNTYYRK